MDKNKKEGGSATPKGEFLVIDKEVTRQPEFFDALMKFQYGEGEESDKGFQKMERIIQESELENLFDQTKNLKGPLGERLSGDPEVLHEIQDWMEYGMSRPQIQKILEYVPSAFLEDWKSPKEFDELNDKEKEAYKEIMKIGPLGIPGPFIQKVIEFGINYRNKYSNLTEG